MMHHTGAVREGWVTRLGLWRSLNHFSQQPGDAQQTWSCRHGRLLSWPVSNLPADHPWSSVLPQEEAGGMPSGTGTEDERGPPRYGTGNRRCRWQ